MGRWLANLIRVQEKRAFHGETVLFFAIFVGAMRLLAEIMFVGFNPENLALELLVYVSWYWLCFFAFGLSVRFFAPPPWQQRINVILVGLFLGFLPPVIDAIWYGWGNSVMGQRGFYYAYIVNFPEGWPWLMVAPDRRMPPGEGLILWGAVIFSAWYVWIRTRSRLRTIASFALAYSTCVFLGALMPTALYKLHQSLEGTEGIRPYFEAMTRDFTALIVLGQIVVAYLIYLIAYRPQFLRVQAERIVHVLPLIGIALVGYAWVRPLDLSALFAALVVLIAGALTVAENDYWDHLEEDPEGPAPVERYDLVFAVVSFWSLTALLVLQGSPIGVVLGVYGVASYLYNSSLYRGKRYFPANLKLEGLWGGSAFGIGMFLAIAPMMTSGARPFWFDRSYSGAPFASVVGVDVVIAAALAFGGWSVLASLKDHKDVETDGRLGAHTVFTLARRGGHDPDAVLGKVRLVAFACMMVGLFGPLAMGRLPWVEAALMLGVALVIWRGPMHPARSVFRRTLVLITAYLVVLAVGLSRMAGV